MSSPEYQFTSHVSNAPPDLNSVDLAFVGDSVDERGTATIDALNAAGGIVSPLAFIADGQRLYLGGDETNRARLAMHMAGKNRVLIDATTLGLGEILNILMAARENQSYSIEFLYAEPKTYTETISKNHDEQNLGTFQLTKNRKFIAVQGFAHECQPKSSSPHVFMLGFEPGRIGNAINQREYIGENPNGIHVVIGVPAFQAGWESNSIVPHLHMFAELEINEKSVTYCKANSIREAYLTLWDIYQQLGDSQGCLYIAPLGTKPHLVGAALFLLETKGNDYSTSLYYDHPVRVLNRSREVTAWHHVVVEMGN